MDYDIQHRYYMMERFLERISLSEYKNQFILKGGMLVAAMLTPTEELATLPALKKQKHI